MATNIEQIISQETDSVNHILKRKDVTYQYPSFFMKVELIPTHVWTYESVSTDDEWTNVGR